MQCRNIVWDLGGTLLDNYAISAQSFCEALGLFSLSQPYAQVYQALRISTAHAVDIFVRPHMDAKRREDFVARYRSIEAGRLSSPVLFAGAREVLQCVVDHQGGNFLVTHRGAQVVDLLRQAAIDSYFTEVLTSASGFPRKPAADSITYLLHRYQLSADNTVAVGDRALDMQAAQNAGIPGIYFAPDSSQMDPAATALAAHTINSLSQLLDYVSG